MPVIQIVLMCCMGALLARQVCMQSCLQVCSAATNTFSARLPSFNVVGRAARPGSTTPRTACLFHLRSLFDLHQARILCRPQQSGHLVASACQYSSEVYQLARNAPDIQIMCNDACAQAMTSLNCIDFVLKAVQYSHGSVDWLADGHGDQATKGVADACHCGNRTRSVKFAPHFAVLLLLQTHPCVDFAFLAHHFADSLRDALMELPARSMHRRFSLSCLPLTSQSVP